MKSIIYKTSYKSPEIDKSEVLRYARSGTDKESLALLDSCISEAQDLFSYNLCYGRFGIKVSEDEIDLGFTKVRSHSLATCLMGCHEIILFGATVGFGIDRLIHKYSITSPSRAIMLQALGSERVEALCDAFCRDVSLSEGELGNVIRPRFSPGYGDLSIELQREIFIALDLTKNLGINLGDNLFMTPTKSVTAIVGIKKG